MSIIRRITGLRCDGNRCTEEIYYNGGDDDDNVAAAYAQSNGWLLQDGDHYCPACAKADEDG